MTRLALDRTAPLAALISMQRAVASSAHDLPAIFRRVVDGAAEVIAACEYAAIAARLDDEWICRAASDSRHFGIHLAAAKHGVAGLVLNEPELIGDARLDGRAEVRSCAARGIRSLLLVPVLHQGTATAVLELASSRPHAFDDADVALAQLLVGMIAGAVASTLPEEAASLRDSADLVEIIGVGGRIEWINPAGLGLLGLPGAAGTIGTEWLQHWPQAHRAAVAAALDAARAGMVGNFSIPRRGGRRCWDVRLTLIRDGHGATGRVLSVARDVTVLHEAAERVELMRAAGGVIGVGAWESGALSIDRQLATAFGIREAAPWQEVRVPALLANVHPQDRDRLHALVRNARLPVGEPRAQFRIRAGDSPWRWVEARGLPVDGEQSQPPRLAGVLIDIDARKRVELELAQNEQTVRHIADQLPFLIAFIAPDLTYRFANRAYGEWFGQPSGGFATRPVVRLFGEAIEDGPELLLRRALSGEANRLDRQLRHGDGTARDVEVRYLPRRGGDGEVDGCYVIGIDITQRKEQERALNRSNRSLEQSLALVQQESEQVWRLARDLLAVFDGKGMLRSFNPAWHVVLGWTEADLQRRFSQEFLHPDDVERSNATFGALAETGSISGFENRWKCQDGSYRWLSWNAVLADGLTYAAGRDVTAEKDSALRLKRAEDQLRQSQKMQAVGQLTGGIAHDFNNLLTGVIGSIEMMRHRVRQGRMAELGRYLDAASGAAERAASLTHRLLSFSRRQTLDPKPVEADQLVAGMEELLRSAAGPLASVQVLRHPGLWTIHCDPRQLEAALLNLANNARDAMPEGGRLVFETANAVLEGPDPSGEILDGDYASEVPAGEYVAISATDTGIGMSGAVASRAFDPFFTTKPIGRGSGLGLSMVYGFARQSGGHARIVSTPGQGARVTIFLPRHHDPVAASPQTLPPTAPALPSGRAVLLVEDEPMVRMLVGEALADLGCTTIEAVDGLGGLRILQGSTAVDLLITGVGLSGALDGRQMVEAARARRPDLKVLFITGTEPESFAGSPCGNAAMQVLGRPVTIELLRQRVQSMMPA